MSIVDVSTEWTVDLECGYAQVKGPRRACVRVRVYGGTGLRTCPRLRLPKNVPYLSRSLAYATSVAPTPANVPSPSGWTLQRCSVVAEYDDTVNVTVPETCVDAAHLFSVRHRTVKPASPELKNI